MVFSSTIFLFLFLPITILVYYCFKRNVLKLSWLLLVSLVFFGWSQPQYLWIILLNIFINYICALLIEDLQKLKKLVLVLSIALNLALLFYFKYFDFVIYSVNKLIGSSFRIKNIILPIGISFFTFQGMSYVIDVYKKDVSAQKNLLKVALYIVMFPQLIAGPIVRYKDIVDEIDERYVSLEDFCYGIERFIIGLSKKAIIANTMAATTDAIWSNGADGNTWSIAWLGSIAYTLQIFFDFSGYSDMAIGLGRLFGFHFNENFNLPYISKSITEFWRRWHISLSTWFRDYVYIPLGGNKKHVYLNLVIVFLLTGIWHGAAWHFVIWGIWHGFFILVERRVKNRKKFVVDNSRGKMSIFSNVLTRIYTLLVVNLGWVLFRASLKDALLYIETMFGIKSPQQVGFTVFWYLDRWTITVMLVGVFFSTSIPKRVGAFLERTLPSKLLMIIKYLLLLILLYLSMLRIVSGTYNPFIYFQF